MSRSFRFCLALTCLLAGGTALPLSAQSIVRGGQPVVDNSLHPDGRIGRPSLSAFYTYFTVEKDPGLPVADIQEFGLSFVLVAGPQVAVVVEGNGETDDSSEYSALGGLKLYFASPTRSTGTRNPDGRIGRPIVTILGGARTVAGIDGDQVLLGMGELTVPVASTVTLGAGYRYDDDLRPGDVRAYFASVTLYSSVSSVDSLYVNPDGPVGSIVAKLTGGGSENGWYGRLETVFSLKPSLSLAAGLTGEWADEPYRRRLGAGIRFNLYAVD